MIPPELLTKWRNATVLRGRREGRVSDVDERRGRLHALVRWLDPWTGQLDRVPEAVLLIELTIVEPDRSGLEGAT